MDQHKADHCRCHKQVQPAQQTLSDMEFDRGIWNAAIYNEKEKVRGFIQKGKSMDRDNCDYTALHYAARNGNEDICKLLIEEGQADVNAVTKGGATSLHRAALMGHMKIVELLIKHQAQLDLQDEDGQTALHRAAIRGHLDVCKYLLQKEPKLKEIPDNKDKIPFEYIPKNANDDFKLLLKPSLEKPSVSAPIPVPAPTTPQSTPISTPATTPTDNVTSVLNQTSENIKQFEEN